jgi:hypothetical protein
LNLFICVYLLCWLLSILHNSYWFTWKRMEKVLIE